MDSINDLFAQAPQLLQSGALVPALLLLGAGTSIFLIADNAAQSFSVFNGLFVILGYLAGAVLALNGVWLVWDVIGPTVQSGAATPVPSQ